MSKQPVRIQIPQVLVDVGTFLSFLRSYVRSRGYGWFSRFEFVKDLIVDILYQKRGKYVRPFLHFGTIGITFFVISFGPLLFNQPDELDSATGGASLLTSSAYGYSFYTQQAEELQQIRGGEIITHVVSDGETLSSIAGRYNLDVSTILWENDITEKDTLTAGQTLRILPIDGLRHKVTRGETIFSIAKKYGLDDSQAQVVVDYPFNEFLNDETFELATGQFIMVPGGVPPQQPAPQRPTVRPTQTAPIAGGDVTGSGSFVWPASGGISQYYQFFHKAIDISNRGGGPILAADSGTVVVSGWPDSSGYGNRVMVDHGNGFVTLYAHMSVLQVSVGQSVSRGSVLGQMGSTGRSTGVHLHFEIRRGGVLLNPLDYLQ
ncbi:MAG: M23 family metallopeptidase [Microgenomates group bacterium]